MKDHKKNIIYIYYSNLLSPKASIIQSLKTIEALAEYYTIDYHTHLLNDQQLKNVLSNYGIKQSFRIRKLPIFPNDHKIILSINQLIYALINCIITQLSNYSFIYTRDFSFLYFLSFVPKWLRPKIPVIFEAHKIYHHTSQLVNFAQEKRAYRVVDFFVATSHNCKNDLQELFNIDGDKILITPNGVDLCQFKRKMVGNTAYHLYGLEDHHKIIAYSGSFLWWKGVDDLVLAMKHVNNPYARLVLIGGDGKDYERINQMVNGEGLSENVILTGYLPQAEMINLLHCAQVAVLPNNRSTEGERYTSPIKLFEYMACGLPIIASRLDSINNILSEPENCLFFEPENQLALAACIDQLLLKPDLRLKMVENNLKAVQNYTWAQKAKTINGFLTKL